MRFDNERGKGDHRHDIDWKESFPYRDVDTLVADFLADIRRMRRELNMEKNIRVELRGEDESAQEFVKAWWRAEAGESAEEPLERLYFQDPGTLLQVLTPRRLELT